MRLSPEHYVPAAVQLAGAGKEGHGELIQQCADAFTALRRSNKVIAAKCQLDLLFNGLRGPVQAIVFHLCSGLICDRDRLRVSYRNSPISTSECMRMTRGIGDPPQHTDDGTTPRTKEEEDRFLELLDEFAKGTSTLDCGLDVWVEAVRALWRAGSVWYIGSSFLIAPHLDSADLLQTHFCTNPHCEEAPLSFQQRVPVDGITGMRCADGFVAVEPLPPPPF